MARVLERTGAVAALAILATLTVACEPTRSSRARSAEDRPSAYLCCTLRFNGSHEASDANYDYPDKVVIPAGTPVHDVWLTSAKAEFVPEGGTTTYSLQFRYGRAAMSPGAFYGMIFLSDDPLARLRADAAVREAIRDGRLLPGMTKGEALMARGYPPAHRTPSINGDEWLYYSQRSLCERVRFVDGRIASIEQTEPPH